MPTQTATSSALVSGGSPVIFVNDVERALEFYRDVLGLKLTYQAGPHYAEVDAGKGFSIGLHPPSPMAKPPGTLGSIQLGFTVAQPIEQVVKQLQARGVKFRKSSAGGTIEDDSAVRLAFFTDPDGNELYLCEVKKG